MKSVIQRAMQVSSPRPVVYRCLSDVGRWIEWYTGCEKSNVLESTGSTMLVDLIFNSMMRISFTAAFDLEQDEVVKFRLVSSKYRLKWGTTYRLLDASGGPGCVVMAEADLDVHGTVPKFLVDHMLKMRLSDINKALEKRAAAQKEALHAAAGMSARLGSASRGALLQGKPPMPSREAKRPKCLVRVIRTAQGDRIWYRGKTFPAR